MWLLFWWHLTFVSVAFDLCFGDIWPLVQWYLTFVSVPEVTSPLTDLIAIDGESCSLSCHVTAPDEAEIVWYRENMVGTNLIRLLHLLVWTFKGDKNTVNLQDSRAIPAQIFSDFALGENVLNIYVFRLIYWYRNEVRHLPYFVIHVKWCFVGKIIRFYIEYKLSSLLVIWVLIIGQ